MYLFRFLIVMVLGCPGVGAEGPVATTTAGKITGLDQGGVRVFLGVPYGGDTAVRRFRPPEPVEPWEGARSCVEFGPIAPQPKGTSKTAFRHADIRQSEDCLNLNVWTPALRDGGKRPIFVYFHGGGFDAQSADLIDGARLCRKGNVVMVAPNHRLGGFGYLYLRETGEPPFADSANVGLLDLVLALKWVKANAAEFGGDPDCVTIFGDSGGAGKCAALTAMPAARGLFHRMWSISGAGVAFPSREFGNAGANRVLSALALTDGRVGELRTLPTERLVAAFDGAYGPVVDGVVLPRNPFEPDASPVSAGVPMVIGTTHDEMASFLVKRTELARLTWENIVEKMASVGMKSQRGLSVPELVEEYRQLYPEYSATEVVYAISTASGIWSIALTQAERRAAQGAPTWVYCLDWPGRGKAAHAIDTALVLDDPAQNWRTAQEPTAQTIADVMSDVFVAFGRNGNPNTLSLPPWPQFETRTRPTMVFELPPRLEEDHRGGERTILERRKK